MGNFKHIKITVLIILLSFLAIDAAGVPPKVIETTPENGAQDVNSNLRQIRIVFDQDMDQGGYSICGGGPNYPETIGKPRWINKRTIVMRVKLAPDHNYQLSINCPSYQNFKNTQGESAEPYPIEFRTGSGKGAKAEASNSTDNAEAIEELRRAIDEDYSYRDLRKVDWAGLFDKYGPAMKDAKTPLEFAEAAANLLAKAEDIHIWVKVGDKTAGGFKRSVTGNYNLKVLEKTIPGWQKRNAAVCTGRFDDGIGYILIDSWSREQTEALEQAYAAIKEFAKAPGLIIDVRSNNGGAEPLAQEFAGCFIDEPKVYARHTYRATGEPGGFTKANSRVLEPNERAKYRGKIAVLMGPEVMSSCESFLLMMKQVPGCKLIGEKSYGSSGNPKPTELGNGVTVYLPSWKDLRPDGTCFEGEGIAPDILIKMTEQELRSRDAVIETALKWLRGSV
ncbi:MAG: Ig-like domain-containing protein [Sedimentisphaerales bacterium]|nr:Ig-like domain-containing protein [Sedimentisphaerales bacterium]